MSSTAIVIKQLKDQQELTRPHGSLSMAILLFQDIAVVPFLNKHGADTGSDQSQWGNPQSPLFRRLKFPVFPMQPCVTKR